MPPNFNPWKIYLFLFVASTSITLVIRRTGAISINKTANVYQSGNNVRRIREQTWNLFTRGLFTRSKYDKYSVASRVDDTSVRESLKGCFEGEGQKTVRDASCFRSTIARRNLLKMVKDERSCTSLPPGSFVRFPIKIPSGSTELVVYIYICMYTQQACIHMYMKKKGLGASSKPITPELILRTVQGRT